MPESCLMEILEFSDEALSRVFRKASTRSLVRLASAYPRSAGRAFMTILARSFSQPTFAFIQEELEAASFPSYAEIRTAEDEIMSLIEAEGLSRPEPYRLAA